MAVTPNEIAVGVGVTAPTPDSPQWLQWSQWIGDALMLIEARAEAVGVLVNSIDQVKIDYVVREAVVAQVKRPDDATQVTVSVDDGQSSRAYRSSTGRVTIRDEWWTLLGLVSRSGAFSVDTAPRTGGPHVPWCSVFFGSYCSCGVDIAGRPIFEVDDDAGF